MFVWVIQMSIMSLVIIILLHNIYIYLKSNLTRPTITDYVTKPSEKYNELYNMISKSTPENTINYETAAVSNMQEELKLFLQQQINKPAGSNETTNIGDLQSINLDSRSNLDTNYSSYD